MPQEKLVLVSLKVVKQKKIGGYSESLNELRKFLLMPKLSCRLL